MRRLRLVLIISETGIWSPIKAVIYNVAAGRELEPVKSKQAHLQWHHWHVHYSNWSRQMARMVIIQTPSLSILSPYWLCISVYQRSLYHNDYYPNTTYFDQGKSVRPKLDMEMDGVLWRFIIWSSMIYDPVYPTASLFTMNILNLSCWISSNDISEILSCWYGNISAHYQDDEVKDERWLVYCVDNISCFTEQSVSQCSVRWSCME